MKGNRNKTGKAWAAVVLMQVAVLVGCDGHHDPLDTSMKAGHILCTDGKTRSYEDYASSGKEAIAVVFYVNHSEEISGTGYAVYLHDLAPEAFADSLGIPQGTSADLTAYDGNENTFALYDTDDVSSPMAMQVFDMWRYGQSAYVPSVAQMRLLYAAKELVNPYIEACGGVPLPEEADECWYWTSTEVEGQETAKAWLFSLGSGAIQETPKLQGHKVRAIVTLYNEE